ncbi:MAG TPA: hypothetical protein PLM74_07850 [Bacillota bacterium]|nr:hypothetical protein [Bacillota bacterium]
MTAVLLAAVLLAWAANGRASGSDRVAVADRDGHRVVVILADGLTWQDCRVRGGTALTRFLSSAAVGCANARTADRGEPLLSACATLGAGRRMTAPESAGYGLGLNEVLHGETAVDVYLRRTRRLPPWGDQREGGADGMLPATAAVCTAWPELERANAESPYRGKPGLLGESLRRAGMAAAAVGNSDDQELVCRPAVLIAMDACGATPWADVGTHTVASDPHAPFGMVCDVGAMAEAAWAAFSAETETEAAGAATDAEVPPVAVLVLDMGDFARLRRYAVNLSPEAYYVQLGLCYERLDALLVELEHSLGPPSEGLAYVLISPSSESGLAPVAVAGWSYGAGLLTSPTTRRAGLVTNLDIAPTILAGLGVDPAWECDGAAMAQATVAADAPGGLTDHVALTMLMEQTLALAAQARGPVLRLFIGLLVVAVFGLLGVIVLGRRVPGWAVRPVRALLVAAGSAPLVMLAGPVVGVQGTAASTVMLIIGCAAMALLMVRVSGSAMWSVVILGGATASVITIDAFTGGKLASTCLLGHSAVLGARYYGIGNELMGVLVGSAAVAGAGLSRMAWPAAAAAAAAMVMLGHPSIGANFGGMVSAAVTSAVIAAMAAGRLPLSGGSARGRRERLVAMAGVGLAILGASAILILWDSRSPRASHIGRAWRTLTQRAGGSGQLALIALRKLAMNIRLLRYTAWTQVLIAFLAILGAMAAGAHGVFQRFRRDHFSLYAALMGGLVGALAAMAVNDSGVVACATLAMMPTLVILGYAADELAARGARE